MPLEVASALCRKIRRGLLTQEQGAKALALLAGLDIDVSWDWDLTERSLAIAVELGQPTAYDAAYLALAEKEQCELLTADAVFAGACEGKYRCVRLFRAQSV
jgi:predicted nucleic acid-binding protein